MNLTFRKLKIHNFLSFGDAEIDFTRSGYTLVVGVNKNTDDAAYSNGSGKSSIWDALSWVLTGDTIRGTKNIVNINTTGGCCVSVEFEFNNHEYTILRAKEHSEYKTNLKIYVDSEDKSGKGIRDTEVLLQQYLPDLTNEIIGSVILLGQGLPQRFTNNSPSGRKEVLEKLSKSDYMIEDIKTRASKRKESLSQELRKLEDELLKLHTQVSSCENNIKNAGLSISALSDISLLKDKQNSLVEQLKLVEGFVTKEQQEKEDLQAQFDTVNKKVSDCNAYLYQKTMEASQEYDSRLMSLKNELAQISGNLSSVDRELIRIQSIKEYCPTCGQKLVGVEKPDTTQLLNEKAQAEDNRKSLQEKIAAIEQEKQSTLANLKATNKEEISRYQEELVELTYKLKELDKTLRDRLQTRADMDKQLQSVNNEIVTHDASLQYLTNVIAENKRSVESLQDNIKAKDSEKLRVDQYVDASNRILRAATTGFRGILLSNIISYIDSKAKSYCKDIFNNDFIEFKLDGNNIRILYSGKEYEGLSGGEKQRIDLIIQFAIRDMLCQYVNFSCNILCLDEVFDALDALGCQNVLKMIAKRLTDVDIIYVISHRPDLEIPYDNRLIVTKEMTGVSSIRYDI